MTDRQAALCYGVTTASVIALGLLILDYPSDRNLILAIVAGLVVGFGSLAYLSKR